MSSTGMSRLERAPNEVIRRILTALCEKDPETEKKALKCLIALAKYYDKSEGRAEISTDTKRKADGPIPEVHLCKNCDEGFLEEDNKDDACCYHPGDLEIDYESTTWDDWDENAHGPMDRDDTRKDYPDGFVWDCCDEPGDEKKGCEVGPHEAVVSTRKRRKLSIDVADREQGSKDEPIVL